MCIYILHHAAFQIPLKSNLRTQQRLPSSSLRMILVAENNFRNKYIFHPVYIHGLCSASKACKEAVPPVFASIQLLRAPTAVVTGPPGRISRALQSPLRPSLRWAAGLIPRQVLGGGVFSSFSPFILSLSSFTEVDNV